LGSVSVAVLALTGSAACPAAADAGANAKPEAELTVQQILERHVAARGGAAAWHKIQTMAWTGRIESGPRGISKRPFLLMFRRPAATRFEIIAEGQRSVRIFDGTQGWKLRSTTAGPPELQDYSAEEISFALDAGGLDGPLIDSEAKGIEVALLGVDSVEGHRAYHLRVTLQTGHVHDAWIDTQSFLELRYDRETFSAAGVRGIVPVYLRNYQTLEGLVIPALIETGGPTATDTDKMIIDKIALNPEVDAAQFSKPNVPSKHRRGALVNMESPPGARPPGH